MAATSIGNAGKILAKTIARCEVHRLSRREFVAFTATGAVVPHLQTPRGTPLAARDVIDRIQQNAGVEWRSETVDTVKAGDPQAAVRGIVTTAMATMDVLKQTVARGANLVVTCEPTFYGRADVPTPPSGRGGSPSVPDRVFAAKRDFIERNSLVVWRFSDHWRARTPNPLAAGLAAALGWSRFKESGDPRRISIPAITLDALAEGVKKQLGARGGIRVVGDPRLRVQTIGLLPGATPLQASLQMLPDVDVVVAGEVREWESVEYARDTVTAGGRKGLILLGRILSEDPGMKVCAEWLGTLVPEVRTTWIRAGDLYWRPA